MHDGLDIGRNFIVQRFNFFPQFIQTRNISDHGEGADKISRWHPRFFHELSNKRFTDPIDHRIGRHRGGDFPPQSMGPNIIFEFIVHWRGEILDQILHKERIIRERCLQQFRVQPVFVVR